MANRHLSTTLATFEARIHKTKNRLVAIPASVQRHLKLLRRANNHILLYSIRPKGGGRWNHHWAQLTFDNEFAIPADVVHIRAGGEVEIKVHRVVRDVDALADDAQSPSAANLLLQLAQNAIGDDRSDGSEHVDDYLYGARNG